MYDGWRAKVDLRNRAVVRALKLDGVIPRPVSRALLDATPEHRRSLRLTFLPPAHRARCVDSRSEPWFGSTVPPPRSTTSY